MKTGIILSILAIFVFFSTDLFSTGKGETENSGDFTPENISSFIIHLTEKGENYRSYSELQRLRSYYPGYLSSLCFSVTESYILYRSGRYEDIINRPAWPEDSEISCADGIFRIDSMIKSGKFEEEFHWRCSAPEYAEYYRKTALYLSIMKEFNDSEQTVKTDYGKYADSYNYSRNLYMMKKSPFIGAAAGIIPGMGYMYAGETGTGIVALIVIMAGSAITYAAHENGVEPLAAVSGAATFFMYAGNIAGGYMQTVKHNRNLTDDLVLRLDKDFMLDKDIDEIYINFGIKANAR